MTIGATNINPYYYDSSVYSSNNPKIAQSYLTNSVAETSSDAYVGNSEGCTDGKDDGKIGFFGAIGNAIKGVGKTLVNGVKGMFTNKQGKFSLGKTLLSVGTIALCVAVPAVGVAAACIGGVMAGAQVVKGAVNASKATTDAEAKAAWQDIGGGTFGVAMSVVGAKAGMKAVGKTSTATNGLASLGKKATIGQKAKAFGHDMVSSTKNSYNKINKFVTSSGIKDTPKALKQRKLQNDAVSKMDAMKKQYGVDSPEYIEAKANYDKISNSAYDISLKARQNAKQIESTVNKYKNTAEYLKDRATFKHDLKKHGITKDTINSLDDTQSQYLTERFAQSSKAYSKLDSKHRAAVEKFDSIDLKKTGQEVIEINKMKSANAKALAKQDAGQVLSDSELQAIADWDALASKGFSQKALNIVNKQNTLQNNVSDKVLSVKTYLTEKKPSVSNIKDSALNSIKHPITSSKAQWAKTLNTIKGFNKQTIKDFGSKLSSPAKKAWDAISTGKYSYSEAVSKFGYDSVAEIVKMMSGSIFAEDMV